jgi:hypothetical protein
MRHDERNGYDSAGGFLMRRALISLTLLLPLFAVTAASQAKPNFAGKWALSDPAAAGGMMIPATMAVVQDEKTVTLTTVGQMGEVKTVFNLDGTEAKSPFEVQGTRIDRVTKAAWDGSKLVLTTISDFQGQSFETKQVWTLGTDGTLTVDATRPDFQGGGAPVTTKSVYKKQ